MSESIAEGIYGMLLVVIKAWFLMLILGGLHSEYAVVPALGYITSLGVVAVAGILFSWPELNLDK